MDDLTQRRLAVLRQLLKGKMSEQEMLHCLQEKRYPNVDLALPDGTIAKNVPYSATPKHNTWRFPAPLAD